ncbi:MAG: aminotransferase class I/II-fold pyridoxal phosphate-dependent enzyme, partial [Eubacteriales bacterium]
KIHQYAIMCAPTTAQFAATEAMRNGDEDVAYMVAEYNRRRTLIVQGLRAIGLDCFEPEGAFYVFPNVGKFGLSSEEFCERLLYEHKIAIVPGTAFGTCGEGFARISYAYSVKHILEALEHIADFVDVLHREGRGPGKTIL